MTPSEKDLRASLHDGEGDPVDVDRIVAAGSAARAQRRTRLAGVAAAVAVVAGAGSITVALTSRDDTGTSSADNAGNAGGAAYSQQRNGAAIAPGEPAPNASSGSSSEAPPDSRVPAACPDAFPQRARPGASRAGALFDRPAASITVCGYGTSTSTPNPASFVYTGTRATELQRSLENARTTPGGAACTAVRTDNQRYLAFLAVDAAGERMRTVTTTLSIPICDTRTTNGVTVRFGWVPPLGVRQQLYALTPGGQPNVLPSRVPSGKNIGTPVR